MKLLRYIILISLCASYKCQNVSLYNTEFDLILEDSSYQFSSHPTKKLSRDNEYTILPEFTIKLPLGVKDYTFYNGKLFEFEFEKKQRIILFVREMKSLVSPIEVSQNKKIIEHIQSYGNFDLSLFELEDRHNRVNRLIDYGKIMVLLVNVKEVNVDEWSVITSEIHLKKSN